MGFLQEAAQQDKMLPVLSPTMPQRQAEPVKGAWTFGTSAAGQAAPSGVLRQEGRKGANFDASQGPIGEREHDGLGTGNHADVGLPLLFEPLSQCRVAPIDAVSHDPIGVQMGLTQPDQHLYRKLGLGAKGNVDRDTRFPATGGIIGPAGGQIQLTVNQGVPTGSNPGEKDADLAVFHTSGGSTILVRDPRRLFAVLGETGLINGHNGVLASQGLHGQSAHFIAHGVLVPDGIGKQALHAVGSGFTGLLSQLPPILARHV
jgi:hypothetical protein